ncbi:MAG: HlyD family secretion protein [Chromatiales bacterium]|jgi:membrane fusion protein (multidrug efflux system)
MRLRNLFIVTLLVLAAGGGWWYYAYTLRHPHTADAYLGMHVVQIASQVSGRVKQVLVKNNQAVHAGDLLFVIDPAPFELAVDQAEARLQQQRDNLAAAQAKVNAADAGVREAHASLVEQQRHSARVRDLVAKGSASKDQGDATERALLDASNNLLAAQAELQAAQAERGAAGDANAPIKAAEAALAQARLDLQHTRVEAPADGVVGELSLRPGGFVNIGTPLFALVETAEVWVDANFKETDLPRIRPGQAAEVRIDLLPGRTFRGRVESLSPASGTAFALLPPENATGNWVKVTQRFPVRVRIMNPIPGLRVGASSEVTIDTGPDPEA